MLYMYAQCHFPIHDKLGYLEHTIRQQKKRIINFVTIKFFTVLSLSQQQAVIFIFLVAINDQTPKVTSHRTYRFACEVPMHHVTLSS